MSMGKRTVAQLREILRHDGYEMDRSVRKAELVAYVENLIECRHVEALELDEKITALREWYAQSAINEAEQVTLRLIESADSGPACQQIRAWWIRTGLDKAGMVTASDTLAARDADHEAALGVQRGRAGFRERIAALR